MATTSAGTSETSPSSANVASAGNSSAPFGKHLYLIFFVLPIVALAVIYLQLRTAPAETIIDLALGLVVVACALTGLGTFLWCVHWGVSRDQEFATEIDSQPTSNQETKERTNSATISESKADSNNSGEPAKLEVANQSWSDKVKL